MTSKNFYRLKSIIRYSIFFSCLVLSGCLSTLNKKVSRAVDWSAPSGAENSCSYWKNYRPTSPTTIIKTPPSQPEDPCIDKSIASKNHEAIRAVAQSAVEVRPRWSSLPESDKWSQVTLETMENETKTAKSQPAKPIWEIAPKDINKFCPNYNKLNVDERKKFWLFFFSAITETESSHCPTSNGNGNLGLFQFELEDLQSSTWRKDFRCTHVTTTAQAQDPSTNIKCGVQGMISLIRQDNLIGGDPSNNTMSKGAAAFWGVLRYDSIHHGDNRPRMDSWFARYTPCHILKK